MLIPAALEGQVNAETVKLIDVGSRFWLKLPTDKHAEADVVLNERGMFIIPDFLLQLRRCDRFLL